LRNEFLSEFVRRAKCDYIISLGRDLEGQQSAQKRGKRPGIRRTQRHQITDQAIRALAVAAEAMRGLDDRNLQVFCDYVRRSLLSPAEFSVALLEGAWALGRVARALWCSSTIEAIQHWDTPCIMRRAQVFKLLLAHYPSVNRAVQ